MKIYRKKLTGCESEPLLHCADSRGCGWRAWKLREDISLRVDWLTYKASWKLTILACCETIAFPVSREQAIRLLAWGGYVQGHMPFSSDFPCYYCGLPNRMF